MLWNLQRWVTKEHSYCHIQFLQKHSYSVHAFNTRETCSSMKLGKLHTEKVKSGSLPSPREHHSDPLPAIQLGSTMFVPWQVRKVAKKMLNVSAGRVQQRHYGKYPQNGERPMSCLWGCRPQNEVFISMAATDDPCPYHGEKSIMSTCPGFS